MKNCITQGKSIKNHKLQILFLSEDSFISTEESNTTGWGGESKIFLKVLKMQFKFDTKLE